jgi:hypothetical protein
MDRESLALGTNPRFSRIIETARQEIQAGRTISLQALERKYGISAPDEAPRRTARKRRRRSAIDR